MKSILIEKPNQLAIIEREIPTPSAGEVRVKVKLAGICGSDSHIYRGHTRDSLLPRSIVSMLTSFPLNAGVAELFAENTVRCLDGK